MTSGLLGVARRGKRGHSPQKKCRIPELTYVREAASVHDSHLSTILTSATVESERIVVVRWTAIFPCSGERSFSGQISTSLASEAQLPRCRSGFSQHPSSHLSSLTKMAGPRLHLWPCAAFV